MADVLCRIGNHQVIRPEAALRTICAGCAGTLGVRALPPPTRPALPCRRCNGMTFVRTLPREQNEAQQAPMAATYTPRTIPATFSKARELLDLDLKAGLGTLEIYICRGCGFVEWYCHDAADVPIGEEYMTELVGTARARRTGERELNWISPRRGDALVCRNSRHEHRAPLDPGAHRRHCRREAEAKVKDLPAWDVVWTRVHRSLEDIATAVAREHVVAWSSIDRTGSDVFPFSATASFGRGEPSTSVEDVVVSVSGHVHGETLRMSADVSRGGGFVLADGPTLEVSQHDAKRDLEKVLESWLTELEMFLLREASPWVVRELGANP